MEKQAARIASWADNVYVKIPITNTKKASSEELIKRLAKRKVKLNITAIMNIDQVKTIMPVLNHEVPSIISVFAGRIADTGRDPIPLMKNFIRSVFHKNLITHILVSLAKNYYLYFKVCI